MIITASKRETASADMIVCFHQKMRNWYLGKFKKEGKTLPVLTRGAKNEMFGPSGPHMHLSVKTKINYSRNIYALTLLSYNQLERRRSDSLCLRGCVLGCDNSVVLVNVYGYGVWVVCG